MNEEEIIVELRKLTAMQKKRTVWSLGVGALIALIFAIFQYNLFKESSFTPQEKVNPITPYRISQDLDTGDLEAASEHCQFLLQKMPHNPELHSKLGWIYVLKNDAKRALEEYKKAYELYPSQENYRDLETIKGKLPSAIAAATNMAAGTVLIFDNLGQLMFADAPPPKNYIRPRNVELILGHKLINSVTNLQVITLNDVESPKALPPLEKEKSR